MQEQETKAQDTISKWQQNAMELEEKCSKLEKNLKGDEMHEACDMNGTKDEIDNMESPSTGTLDNHTNPKTQHNDNIEELQEALKAAHDTLAKDEEIVHQWEGKLRTARTEMIETIE